MIYIKKYYNIKNVIVDNILVYKHKLVMLDYHLIKLYNNDEFKIREVVPLKKIIKAILNFSVLKCGGSL